MTIEFVENAIHKMMEATCKNAGCDSDCANIICPKMT